MTEETSAPRLDLRWLTEDKPCPAGVVPAASGGLELKTVDGSRLFGSLILPDGTYPKPWPCAVLLHGYPGTSRNDDLAQALRRCGVAVAVPHLRGAWGSEGAYSFAHIIEDAVALANSVRAGELSRVMNADAEAVFLIGHSMGGWTALNAAASLPWLRGLCLIGPYDLGWHLRGGQPDKLKELLLEGEIMRTNGQSALFAEACALKDRSFAAAFSAVCDKDLAVVGGEFDDVAPTAMTEPLWRLLEAHPSQAVRRRLVLPADHAFNSHRVALCRFVAQFIADSCARPSMV